MYDSESASMGNPVQTVSTEPVPISIVTNSLSSPLARAPDSVHRFPLASAVIELIVVPFPNKFPPVVLSTKSIT